MSDETPFVAVSDIVVPEAGAEALEDAFRFRLGAVDGWPGFLGLEVWRDRADPTRYVMVSRWTSKAHFDRYLHSADHRRSHQRIPSGEHRPRPAGFRRYDLVAR